jgi:hypothetical protein
MNSTTIGLIILLIIFLVVAFKFFTQSLADFLDKGAKSTLWLWLPFVALKRLTKQFNEKYKK